VAATACGRLEVTVDRTVIGRRTELARIDEFLAAARISARTLVIDGDPGMGKTTLWLAALARAAGSGTTTLSARPSGAEATFAWAAIGDLLDSVPDEVLRGLPPPQARALRVALLRETPAPDTPASEPRAIAVALLNALRLLARDRPVLVAVDDVQWLDPASATALAFAIRRLRDEPVGFLLAHRIVGGELAPAILDAIPADAAGEHIGLGPLDLRSTGSLLVDAGLDLPRETVRRIHAASGGNPFFALELGRAAEAGLPLSGSLLPLVGRRVAVLPPATRDVLAFAAALSSRRTSRLGQAVGEDLETLLAPALEARVVEHRGEHGEQLDFTHPLLRTAALEGVAPARRREIHARLAEVVEDLEERARHLALSSEGPDEAVARELEAAAGHARARGAATAAADLAGLARTLTPPDRSSDALRRALAEADHAMIGGDAERARAILVPLLDAAAGVDRPRVMLLLAIVDLQAFDLASSAALLRETLRDTDDDRIRMRAEGVLTAVLDELEEDVPDALRHGLAELAIAERLNDTVHIATALRGIARNEQRATGRYATARIERALALEPAVRPVRMVFEWPSVCRAEMDGWTDDMAAALDEWEVLLGHAVERGEEPSLTWTFVKLSQLECVVGRLESALRHTTEGLELTMGADHPVGRAAMLASHALVLAHLGDEAACRAAATTAATLAASSGALMAERTLAWARGLLELSLGNAPAAHEHLGPLVARARAAGIGEPGALRFVPDDLEALVGSGRLDEAEPLLAWFTALADDTGRVHAQAAADRCRGLMLAARGDGPGALEALGRSRERFARATHPFGAGRTLLALGAAQRRALRRRDARATLEQAVTQFETLGASRWQAMARRELGAISGRQAGGEALSEAERRVAELVAEGRSNREVAALLYLTERTVESHLTRVYAKLGIRSRAALAAAWAGGERGDAGP
jgi:DNA-binding CsgD family transcriptional regulator